MVLAHKTFWPSFFFFCKVCTVTIIISDEGAHPQDCCMPLTRLGALAPRNLCGIRWYLGKMRLGQDLYLCSFLSSGPWTPKGSMCRIQGVCELG